jgi:acetylornithine deacetylase/succinyl-diaminopimelate desuccinylase-like protein
VRYRSILTNKGWDVGYGVHDDAGGVFQAYQALRAMIKQKLRPKRTIRLIAWTGYFVIYHY